MAATLALKTEGRERVDVLHKMVSRMEFNGCLAICELNFKRTKRSFFSGKRLKKAKGRPVGFAQFHNFYVTAFRY